MYVYNFFLTLRFIVLTNKKELKSITEATINKSQNVYIQILHFSNE